jgi:dihydroxyacetone kinase
MLYMWTRERGRRKVAGTVILAAITTVTVGSTDMIVTPTDTGIETVIPSLQEGGQGLVHDHLPVTGTAHLDTDGDQGHGRLARTEGIEGEDLEVHQGGEVVVEGVAQSHPL